MDDKSTAVFLTALILGCLLICGVVMPILDFLIEGLWPYKEIVSLSLVGLLVFAVISGQARKTLRNLSEVSHSLPGILDVALTFIRHVRTFKGHAPDSGCSPQDYSSEQGIPYQGYGGLTHEGLHQ